MNDIRTRHFQSTLLALVAIASIAAVHRHPVEQPLVVLAPLGEVFRIPGDLTVGGTTDTTGETIARTGVRLTTPTTGPIISSGAGDPNGSVNATKGSVRVRTDTAQVYQNTDGAMAWSVVGGSSTPAFHGVRIVYSSQSIANTTEQTLVSATESFDTDAYHDIVTNTGRLTVPSGKAGYYFITCTASGVVAASNNQLTIRLNGGNNPSAGTPISQALTGNAQSGVVHDTQTIYQLAVGDEVQCTYYQNAGIAQNAAASPISSFAMNLIGN